MKISITRSRLGNLEDIVNIISEEHWRSNAVMEVGEGTVRKWIKNKNSVVAVAGGKVVGHEALDVWPKSRWAELRSAVVLEQFRGMGIAYKMTKMLIDDFVKRNPDAIFVAIKNKTERGNGILLDMGFEEIGLNEVPGELFTIRSHSERKAFRLGPKV